MVRLEHILPNTSLEGVEHGQTVQVVTANMLGSDACVLYYKSPSGALHERMLFRSDEANLSVATDTLPWSFVASGEHFRLTAEAIRIHLAHLFDPMMAVHTSNVEPLPHQISAVYESMLPRQPLRFVLADDPGAGKTIMAGLLIRELLMRADAQRVLVIAPGGLVDQWREELFTKFALAFSIFTKEMNDNALSGNPFDEHNLLIARLDQLKRHEDLQEKLAHSSWDIIIMDEAHKLSASFYGSKVHETKRFKLAKLLGKTTRHLLLMTATPHNGKEEDFQLFLSLLDADRFCGKPREKAQRVEVSDVMRRLIKEELYRFDGTRLFPERRAYTANYMLSPHEEALYEAVTQYVRDEMGKADRLQGAHKGRVGFALTALQRRLASSPQAIWASLRRRKKRLQKRLIDMQDAQFSPDNMNLPKDVRNFDAYLDNTFDDDDFSAEQMEQAEEVLIDQATAARTQRELEKEIALLEKLEQQAHAVLHSGTDKKWEQLSSILQDNTHMRTSDGQQRKLIIFTEHRDTLEYLKERIAGVLCTPDATVSIHGGVRRDERLLVQERFRHDKKVRILLATDAAGEGVNLQVAHLMVNYDLPWNPNRLEQRFGRIHRIGQKEVCHLWNMVAINTREGEVFVRLLEKLKAAQSSLGGQVFNVLGEIFSDVKLKDLLLEAIRYGDDPQRREWLTTQVDNATEISWIQEVMKRNTLCEEIMPLESVFAIRDEMEKAEARKLQPHYIRAFFLTAFAQLGGVAYKRERGRYEITHVPSKIQDKGKHKRDHRHNNPVLRRYERICFEKEHIELPTGGGAHAALMHPGHPLLRAILTLFQEELSDTLHQGTILLDPCDMGEEPRLLCIIDHCIRPESQGGHESNVSQRLHFVELDAHGEAVHGGWAPYLDYEILTKEQHEAVLPLLQSKTFSCLTKAPEQLALAYATQHLVPQHLDEVRTRRTLQAQRTQSAVHERLTKEIHYQGNLLFSYDEKQKAGKDMRLNIDNTKRLIEELNYRLESRTKELQAMQRVVSATPVMRGAALIVPQGLLDKLQGTSSAPARTSDAAARQRVELCAMRCVMDAEKARGNSVTDVSAHKCGWDITSQPPVRSDGVRPPARHIEVKGRAVGQTTITVTKNEILSALNQGDKFWLAIVFVDGDKADTLHYVRQPFTKEPDWHACSVNYDIADILQSVTSE